MLTCVDFPDAPTCCDSCHDDADQLGYDLCQIFVDGQEGCVCCSVANYLDKEPSQPKESALN